MKCDNEKPDPTLTRSCNYKYLNWPRHANALLLLGAALLMSGASAPVNSMGKLSEYTQAIFDCPGFKLFGWGPSHSAIQTANMEPIDICLYNVKAHRGLKFKIPAAYIDVMLNDESGKLGVVGLQFWMPGFRPASVVPELRQRDSKKRLQYFNDNQRNLVKISLKSTTSIPGHPDYERRREYHKWEFRADLGLEHYKERCETLYELKRAGRDISTRKCEASYSSEEYLGRSKVTNGSISIRCNRGNEVCHVNTAFEGHSLEFNILPTELSRLTEFETATDQFLRNYLIEKLPPDNTK